MPGKTINFTTKPCPQCGGEALLKLSVEGIEAYHGGVLLQDAFPELSAADRERMLSGYCGDCWKILFPKED